jgi:hypothetical protein
MSNDNIWGMLSKKKKNTTLTVPTKPTPKSQSMGPVNNQPVKVKVQRIKPVQAQAHPQTHEYQNTDFKFLISVDQAGISILTNFQGKLIHKFLLPSTDYALFVGLNPQLKFNYVQVRVSPNAFWGDANLIHQMVLTIINVLDTLFAEAARIQAQQRRV